MKIDLIWKGRVYDKDKVEKCIWDACFSPDGKRIVIATDKLAIVYNSEDGSKLKILKNHKSFVYCVSYSADGGTFASGSADGTVFLWNSESYEGILKFHLADAIQCLSFNPVTNILISGALSEYGIWTPEQKVIKKTRTSSRVTCCSWTTDGQYLALGMYNGTISIRNSSGEEKLVFERSGGAATPVWTLEWTKTDQVDILAVGDWGQKLSFYQLSGKKIGKEINLNFDPCRVSWLKNSYLMVCGSDHKLYLYNKDGIKIDEIFSQDSWLWCCKANPADGNKVIACGQDGTFNYLQIQFLTIHSLYRDRYSFRDGMTDVIIHHLVTDQKARIKCKDVIRKVAIYKNRLAVQFPDKVNIYQPQSDDPNDMQYRNVDKINRAIECNLMIVTTRHLILCEERRLSSYGYSGVKEREWLLDSPIRYTKIMGGPEYKEGILIGQKNGQITKIYLDNHFPIPILKCENGIKCLDISLSRKKLGVIDESDVLTVYDLNNGNVLFHENGVLSLAFNTKNDDMICYADENSMFIKASDYPSHQIKETGLVVGFNGTKVYMLQDWVMKTIEIPQSAAMYSYIQKEEFEKAYRVACLGVTNSDWKILGESALNKMNNFDIAKQAFIKIQDPYYLYLINELEEMISHGDTNKDLLTGFIYAHLCNFTEAAKYFRLAHAENLVVEMYSDSGQFDKAKNLASKSNPEETKSILAKQADWAKNTKEHHSAVTMYLEAGQYTKALEIMKENEWCDMIIDLARKLDMNQHDLIEKCGVYLKQMDNYLYASECFQKISDISSMINTLVEGRLWDEAFSVLKSYPEFKEAVYVPYAQSLAENDNFEEAQIAFHNAGLENEALHVLEKLTKNSVVEQRFDDASYYYWKLSMQCLDIARTNRDKKDKMLQKFWDFQNKANMYYVYYFIHRFMEEPMASLISEAYFYMARYLTHSLMKVDNLDGISKVVVYLALAKKGKELGAFKISRYAYEKMQSLRIPERFKKTAQLGALTIRSKPFHDNEDILPYCYKCNTNNPLLNQAGNICVNCREPFVHSFIIFDALPLVEFHLEDGISDEEAIELINSEPMINTNSSQQNSKEHQSNGYQSLILNDAEAEEYSDDPFGKKLLNINASGDDNRIILDRETLRNIPSTEIIVLKWPAPLKYQYYKNIISDVTVTHCEYCLRLFHTEDFEIQILQKEICPFCRTSYKD